MSAILVIFLCIVHLCVCLDSPIRCMNFYGLETPRDGLVCDWVHEPRHYLERLKLYLGVEFIRLPFSHEYVRAGNLQNLDMMMNETFQLGLHVIFDYHRTWSDHQGPSPEEGIGFDEFLETWSIILDRYKDFTNVYGLGVFNEIQHNDTEYVQDMHEKFIRYFEELYPGRYFYFCGCIGWGGNCSTIDLSHLPEWNRIYIEVHKYQFSGRSDPQDWDISMPQRISPEHWFVGETGWKQQDDGQVEWAKTFLAYLEKRHIKNVCAWTIAHSVDTDGWWLDDCETFNFEKGCLLRKFWFGGFEEVARQG